MLGELVSESKITEESDDRLPVVLVSHAAYLRILAHAARRHDDRIRVVGMIRTDYKSLGPKTKEAGEIIFRRYPWFSLKVMFFEVFPSILAAARSAISLSPDMNAPTIRLSEKEKMTTDVGKQKVLSFLEGILGGEEGGACVLVSWMAPLIPKEVLRRFDASINLHPANLPGAGGYGCWLPIFGDEGYQHAWTVHVMADEIDKGRILRRFDRPQPKSLWMHQANDPPEQAEALMNYLCTFQPKDVETGEDQPADASVYTLTTLFKDFDRWYDRTKAKGALRLRMRDVLRIMRNNLRA